MRQILGSVVFLALACPLTFADEKADALKKLNGTYDVLSLVVEGKADPKKADKVIFVIEDGKLSVIEGGKKDRDNKAKITVDPSKKPAQIDVTPEDGKKGTLLGIYELKETDKGAELTIALGRDMTERPKDFKGEGKGEMAVKLLKKKEK
jgi:uncharacterized protein (TIGR03067 family)